MLESEFSKVQLKYLEKSIKRSKTYNILVYIWFIMCLIFLSYYGFKVFNYTIMASDKELTIFTNIACFGCWIFNSTLSLKNLKKNKRTMEKDIVEYNELLKSVDYPRFLREQRKIKMSKIKKRIF